MQLVEPELLLELATQALDDQGQPDHDDDHADQPDQPAPSGMFHHLGRHRLLLLGLGLVRTAGDEAEGRHRERGVDDAPDQGLQSRTGLATLDRGPEHRFAQAP